MLSSYLREPLVGGWSGDEFGRTIPRGELAQASPSTYGVVEPGCRRKSGVRGEVKVDEESWVLEGVEPEREVGGYGEVSP